MDEEKELNEIVAEMRREKAKIWRANNKEKVIEFVTNLGLTPEIYSCDKGYELEGKSCINTQDTSIIKNAKKSNTLHEAHSIGGYNGESPLTLAAAYSAFAREGIYIEPYTFTKIIYQVSGQEYLNDINKKEAMSEETAYMISDMLVTTATQAMGRYYKINNVKYAAKTGTTNYDANKLKELGLQWSGAVNDLWTVGYNTEYTIGVWYGYDKLTKEHYNKLSSAQHTRLFQAIGKKVFTNNNEFKKPSTVISVEVESQCPEPTLPSEYTPSDLRMKELFIKGTEPTSVSERFKKLDSVSNLKVKEINGEITLTWDEVTTPEINTKDYLLKYYSSVFEKDDYLESFVNSRLDYNKNNIGDLGYNIYLKDENGNLELLDFVSTNSYKFTADKTDKYTFVVKTAYSIFKSNMSDEKSITIDVVIEPTAPIIPETPNTNDGNTDNSNSTENKPMNPSTPS